MRSHVAYKSTKASLQVRSMVFVILCGGKCCKPKHGLPSYDINKLQRHKRLRFTATLIPEECHQRPNTLGKYEMLVSRDRVIDHGTKKLRCISAAATGQVLVPATALYDAGLSPAMKQ